MIAKEGFKDKVQYRKMSVIDTRLIQYSNGYGTKSVIDTHFPTECSSHAASFDNSILHVASGLVLPRHQNNTNQKGANYFRHCTAQNLMMITEPSSSIINKHFSKGSIPSLLHTLTRIPYQSRNPNPNAPNRVTRDAGSFPWDVIDSSPGPVQSGAIRLQQ